MTDDAPTTTPTITHRGFQHMDPVPSTHSGHVKVYESSAAVSPHIWVNVECPANLNEPTGPTTRATAHLTLENAAILRDQLTYLIDNHYQMQD